MSDIENLEELRKYLVLMEQTFEALADEGETGGEAQLALTLSGYAIDDLIQRRDHSPPLQIVVLGPTQVGKSTVVNLLLEDQHAVASPLAAYTEYLHGFSQGVEVDELDRITKILNDGSSLQRVDGSAGQRRIVWDTPDFDSHRSHGFRKSIAKIAAYADVFVLVVSKEKYADLSVWQMMGLIKPLQRPIVICLNKVPEDQSILVSALQQKLRDAGWSSKDVPICTLPQVQEPIFQSLSAGNDARILSSAIDAKTSQIKPSARPHGVRSVIENNWQDWLQPALEEIAADRTWQCQVDTVLRTALEDYRLRYLDHDRQYAEFNRAVLQLLELLEIPILSRPLSKVRAVLTWPLRKLVGGTDQNDATAYHKPEAGVLLDSLDHLIVRLRRELSEAGIGPGANGASRGGHALHWWRSLGGVYSSQTKQITEGFSQHINEYQITFEPEIEAAAQELYQHLKQSPVTLNALRTARVATDAGGVLLAIKTGTIGATEALLTPAMLSLTSFLTEGAIGTYMMSAKKELKDRQFECVNELFDAHVAKSLQSLPEAMTDRALFKLNNEDIDRMQLLKESF